jgi:hypothetical protein
MTGQSMAIDTLKYTKALKAAGVPAAQPKAQAEALRDTLVPELATKQDLKDTEAALRGDLTAMESVLKGDMAAMKSELRAEIVDVRTGLKAEIAGVRTDLKAEIADLRTDMWRMGMAAILATTTLVTFAQRLFN